MYLQNLPYTEINTNFDKSKTVIVLPISTIEQHGPHLPLGTKGFIEEAIASEAAKILKRDAIQVLIFPTLYYAPCHISDGFDYNIHVSARTFSDFLYEIGYSAYRCGFKYFCLLNFSISPDTLKAIQVAIEDLQKLEGYFAFDPMPLWIFSNYEGFENELKEYNVDPRSEIHADIKETSALLYLDPVLVKKDILASLNSNTTIPKWELFKGNYTFIDMGAKNGYVGSPSLANEELGKKFIEKAAEILATSIKFVYNGNKLPPLPISIRMILKLIDLDEI